jgi:hypothetical protein
MHGNDGKGRKGRIKHTRQDTGAKQHPVSPKAFLFLVAELAPVRGGQTLHGAIRPFLPFPSFPCILVQ